MQQIFAFGFPFATYTFGAIPGPSFTSVELAAPSAAPRFVPFGVKY